MFTCRKCGSTYFTNHSCPGLVVAREPEPVFSDNWSATLWNVRELRKEVAALRAEIRRAEIGDELDRLALANHWAEHG